MTPHPSRRRLLASAGLALSGTVLASSAGARPADSDATTPSPPERWNRTYSRAAYNNVSAFTETGDGSLVAIGSVQSQDTDPTPWLFSVDRTSGRGQWERTIPNSDLPTDGQTRFAAIDTTSDGLVAVGNPLSSSDGRIELLRTTTDGEVTGRGLYGPTGDNERLSVFDVTSVSDGALYSAGYTETDPDTGQPAVADGVVGKVDASGEQVWQHRPITEEWTLFYSILETDDTMLAVGLILEPIEEDASETPPYRSVLVAFDESGAVEWQQEYSLSTDGTTHALNRLADVVPTDDGYLLVGQNRRERGEQTRGWVVATDDAGEVQAQNTFAPGGFTNVQTAAVGDGRYYLAGTVAQNQFSSTTNGFLAEVDTSGAVQWTVTAGPNAQNTFADVLATDDGGVAVAGSTRRSEEGDGPTAEAWLAKLGGDEAPATPTPSPTPTPNPTPTPTDTPTPTPTPTSSPTSTPEPETTTSSGSGPGFTVGGALAGLAGLLYRRSDHSLLGDDDSE